jgi:hypothetical protein
VNSVRSSAQSSGSAISARRLWLSPSTRLPSLTVPPVKGAGPSAKSVLITTVPSGSVNVTDW